MFGSPHTAFTRFLLTLQNLSEEVVGFIEASSFDEIRRLLVKPISWDTGSASDEEIQEDVDRKIVYHGNHLRLTPEQSRKAIPPLIQRVRQTACRKADRFLEKKDFLEEFEKATFIPVPVSVINCLARATSSEAASPLAHDLSLGSQFESMPPPLPKPLKELNWLPRTDDLTRFSVLVMLGASSIGKTTLARLCSMKRPGGG